MAELLIFGFLFVVVVLVGWLLLAGDRERDIVDEDQTLDVQNHQGDE